MGASEGQVILFNVMWTESWGVLRCPDNSDMPNWQEAGCELSGRRHWLFVLNQFSHYHSAQTSSKVTSSKRAWLWQKFAEATGCSFWHIYAAPTAHGGAEQQWTCRFSTMSAKPHKTSFKILPSHILNSIGGSVWRNCWDKLCLCAGGWLTVMTQPCWASEHQPPTLRLLWLDPAMQVRGEEWGGKCGSGRRFRLCRDNDGTSSQQRKWHRTLRHRCDEWEVLIIPQQCDKWRVRLCTFLPRSGSKSRKRSICYNTMLHWSSSIG